MSEINCLICGEDLKYRRHPIFTTSSEHSQAVIYDVIAKILFLDLETDTLTAEEKDSICVCESCFGKINNYDLGTTLATKAQKELERLVTEKLRRDTIKKEVDTETDEEINEVTDSQVPSPSGSMSVEASDSEPEIDLQSEKNKEIEALIPDDIDENNTLEEHLEESLEEYLDSDIQQEASNDEPPVQYLIVETNEESEKPPPNVSSVEFVNKPRRKLKNPYDPSKWYCDICGSGYKTKAALQIHVGLHNGLSPHECPECHKKFSQKSALMRHMPLHTGEKPYQCDICGKQFIHYSSFHMHTLAHNGVRDKKCNICGMELRSSSHLKRHMRVHTGEKPYACPQCGQKFAQRYNMNAHFKAHQGIKRSATIKSTECPICKAGVKGRGKLREHLKEKHGQVLAVGREGTLEDEGDIGYVIIKEEVSTMLPDGSKVEGVALLS